MKQSARFTPLLIALALVAAAPAFATESVLDKSAPAFTLDSKLLATTAPVPQTAAMQTAPQATLTAKMVPVEPLTAQVGMQTAPAKQLGVLVSSGQFRDQVAKSSERGGMGVKMAMTSGEKAGDMTMAEVSPPTAPLAGWRSKIGHQKTVTECNKTTSRKYGEV